MFNKILHDNQMIDDILFNIDHKVLTTQLDIDDCIK